MSVFVARRPMQTAPIARNVQVPKQFQFVKKHEDYLLKRDQFEVGFRPLEIQDKTWQSALILDVLRI